MGDILKNRYSILVKKYASQKLNIVVLVAER